MILEHAHIPPIFLGVVARPRYKVRISHLCNLGSYITGESHNCNQIAKFRPKFKSLLRLVFKGNIQIITQTAERHQKRFISSMLKTFSKEIFKLSLKLLKDIRRDESRQC